MCSRISGKCPQRSQALVACSYTAATFLLQPLEESCYETLAMLLGVLATYNATITFTDVPDGQWYSEPINRLAEAGVVSGIGQNRFNPGGNVANAEMVKMVVNAFFRENYNAYEAAHRNEMSTYFGSQLYWFSHMAYYAKEVGLLNGASAQYGVNMDIKNYASCYTAMTRYDMALVLTNAAKAKGIEATAAQKSAAQNSITDYAYIPVAYRNAAENCFALGLLNGKDGAFDGSANMTRAEACAVITRLEDLIIKHGGGTTNPDPIVTPDPTPSQPDEPTLANGQPITEANVKAVLAEIKTQWPDGTPWTVTTTNPNGAGYLVTMGMTQLNAGATTACGGYATMVSDLIFGKTTNPCRRVTNFADLRPGDIICSYSKDHAMVVIDKVETGSRAGAVFVTSGNVSGKVEWPAGTSQWYAYLESDLGDYAAITRYPE